MTRVSDVNVVLAELTEKPVFLIAAGERHDDVAPKLVVEAELQRVGQHAGGTGVGRLRNDLLGIEMHVEQARRPPCQPRAVGRAVDAADRGIVETLLE